MFLAAGETKEDVFNLTCFYLAKGTYTFVLEGEHFRDSVLTEWVIDGDNKFHPLPGKIGKYHLYSGKFTANSVTVKFE